MKKLRLSVLATALFAGIALTACSSEGGEAVPAKARTLSDVKVGMICLHDNSSTYDKNFLDSINNAVENCGLADGQLIVKTNIAESDACKTAADELVEQGCDIIIADSFGHENFIKQAAQENPNVEFLHCTGTQAHTSGLANFHNGFASIYEGRYLAGVTAGLKLKEMKEKDPTVASKVGYVGAFTYAEVMSGYTSWYLGVKSIVSDVTMDVRFTGSWYDATGEKEAADTLIKEGAVIVSQHADSMGAPNACEENGVPNVSYNGSTFSKCPETFLISSRIDWTSTFEKLIFARANQETLGYDIVGDLLDGSVKVTDVGTAAAARTTAIINSVKTELIKGTRQVFDCSTFTVKNAWDGDTEGTGFRAGATVDADYHLTSFMADVDFDTADAGDTQVIENGAFAESKYRAAPYFNVEIDGITLKNRAY